MTTLQTLLNSIPNMNDTELKVVEGHLMTSYQGFLANKKLQDTPRLREIAASQAGTDVFQVYSATKKRRSVLDNQPVSTPTVNIDLQTITNQLKSALGI